jgi:rod shape-determining protein MreC
VNWLRRGRRTLLAVALLVLLALMLRASVRAPERLGPVDRLLVRITAPMQSVAVRLLSHVSQSWTHYVSLVGVQRDNERLQAENAQLRMQLLAATQLAGRAERLQKLLDLRSQVLSDTTAAQVIGLEVSRQFRVMRLRLDRGGAEIKPGMPVLSAGGIVGRILRVVGPYSDVQLSTDPRSSVDVLLPRTGSRGVLKGVTNDSNYVSRIEYLVQKDEVQVGDEVVTSGLGGIFPPDMAVGRVVRLRKSAASMYQEVEVAPVVDFGKLREVMIVLSPPPPADPDAGKRPPEALRGIGVVR